jgi:hypothetical protein
MKVALLLSMLALLAVAEGCFWRQQKQQNKTPEWLTKETLNEFNSALDKQNKNRGRRDVSTSSEDVVIASVTPSTEAPTGFWSSLAKGAKDLYKKTKDDAKTLADRLEDNLGL